MVTPEERAARMARLQEASNQSIKEQLELERKINSMNDQELQDWINEDPELQEFVCVGDDGVTGELQFDLKAKYTNDNTVDFNPPWETGDSISQIAKQEGIPTYVNGGSLYQPFGSMYNADPRQKAYTKGMSLYNINPYNFIDAQDMLDYYAYCEKERNKQVEVQRMMYRLAWQANNEYTEEKKNWLDENIKFISADEIVEMREKAAKEAYFANQKRMFGSADEIQTDGYDPRGYRKKRVLGVVLRRNGKVIHDTREGLKVDEEGYSYKMINIMDDRAEEKRQQDLIADRQRGIAYLQRAHDIMVRNYYETQRFYEEAHRRGLSPEEACSEYMYKDVNWKDNEKKLWRALQTTAYSKDRFSEILNQLCNTNIDYSNRSHMFCVSYDMARDLKFQSLLESEEDMAKNETVTQKLRDEYEMKRAAFMKKVESGNFCGPDSQMAYYKPTCGKPNIDKLTLEDFNNPVNHIMYTKLYHPEYAMENSFIPELKAEDDILPPVIQPQQLSQDDSSGNEPVSGFNHTDQEILDLY